MQRISSRWETGITSSHRLAVEVKLGGQKLEPVDGTVTLDITASTRGRADLSFADPALIPETPSDTLAPYSNELSIARGITYSDGTSELKQLGLLRIEEAEITDQVSVNLLDRSVRVAEAKFEETYTTAEGTNLVTEIENICRWAIPDLTTEFSTRTAPTITLHAEEGDDRWEYCQSIAAALGCDLYFNALGVLTLRTVPDVTNPPVAYLVEGEAGVSVRPPTLLDLTKRWSRTETFNRWKAVGDNPDVDTAPPSAVATDDQPNSPTRYGGPFGKKPADVFSSPMIENTDQAQDAANGLRAKGIGAVQSVDFGALVNPALEPGDVVHVTRTRRDPTDLDRLVKVADENHIIDSLTIPLTADGTMSGTTRAIQVR